MNDDFREDLATTHDPRAVHERLAREVWERLPTSSVHLMPLAPGPGGKHESVLYHRKDIVDELLAVVARAVQTLQAEPDLPNPFHAPRRAIRVEDALGWSRWLGSAVYQEFFRRAESARQLVVGLVDQWQVPRAFLAVCRSESDDVISQAEEEFVLRVRDESERALGAFDVVPDWRQPANAILDALSTTLPMPAILMSGQRVLWMNDEAKLRLGMVSLSFGSDVFYVGGGSVLAELLACVRRELDRPGSALAGLEQPALSWSLPGESLIVRRLSEQERTGYCLVCLCSPPPLAAPRPQRDELARAHGLTHREADITLLAIEGYSVLSIASRLNIAASTVCTHLKRIYRKLGVRSRAELAWCLASRIAAVRGGG